MLCYSAKIGRVLLLMLLAATPLLAAPAAPSVSVPASEPRSVPSGDTDVMRAFTDRPIERDSTLEVSDQEKHVILFVMGTALIVFLLATAVLGIAMALYGKQLFVAHMIFAGFSVTLAIAHSVVAIVWFAPF